MYIGAPAEIVGVSDYESLQCVDIKTLIREEMDDGRILDPMYISRVFVKLQNSGGFKQKLPVKKGDQLTLCFAHKSLSSFQQK